MSKSSSQGPLVSVIIPVFNRADTLAHALRSVIAQDYGHLEVIVVDDGSTDRPESTLSAVCGPHAVLLRHESNMGAAAARNTGVNRAHGEYIAFLDSDDIWYPGKVRRQVERMQAFPELDAVCTGVKLFHAGVTAGEYRVPKSNECTRQGMLDGCTVSPGTTLMFRHRIWRRVGEFDSGLGRLEDWDWLLRFAMEHGLGVVPEVLARVNVGKRPDVKVVVAAVQGMEDRHSKALLDAQGSEAQRRFLASLQIELAAAHASAGNWGRVLGHTFKAAMISPARVFALLERRWHRRRGSPASAWQDKEDGQ